MDIAYFIINNIKYIFDYNKYRFEIYKLVNNEKYSLTEEERKYFDNILKKSNSFILNSEKLDSIILNNISINNSNDELKEILKVLEKIVPDDCRNNLYNNLKTLSINEVSQDNLENNLIAANYDALNNTIKINPNNRIYVNDSLKLKQTILHELVHMASSYYDKENNIISSGFHKIDLNGKQVFNGLAITEGMTEVLSYNALPKVGFLSSAYLVESMIITQLSCILGDKFMISSYFQNKGEEALKEKMSELIDDNKKIASTFINIELDFYFRDEADKTNALSIAQANLIDFLEARCKKLMSESIDDSNKIQEVISILSKFNDALLTPERISLIGYDSSKYEGLNENLNKFKNMFNKYMTLVYSTTNKIDGNNEFSDTKYSSII